MSIKEKLIQELRAKIVEINTQKEELNSINQIKEAISTIITKISTIISLQEKKEKIPKEFNISKNDIISLDTNVIKKIFPDIKDKHITNLDFYQKRWGGFAFNAKSKSVLNNLNSICDDLSKLIKDKEKLISTTNINRESIQKVLNILENYYINISKEELDLIVETLKELGKSEFEIFEYLKNLANDIEQKILLSKKNGTSYHEVEEAEENFEEILEENKENSDTIKQRIIEILKKNGYEKLVPYLEEKQNSKIEKIKKDLFTYGKINNIEEIIKTFKEYNINLLEEVENGNLYKIITLLLYSSKENIDKIFNLALDPQICICKYDEQGNLLLAEQGNLQINFTKLLERVSRFISRKRRYKRRKDATQIIEITSEVEGNLGDYIKNINFFKENGVDIKGIFKRVEQGSKEKGNYFDIPHEKILRNKMIFDIYKIPPSKYFSRLDSFVATNPADAIEMFIELDLFEYIQTKVSRLNLLPDHPIFYRIARTYQIADTLPNPDNLPLHQNAKQFLFRNWHGDESGKYIEGVLDGYISNPEKHKINDLKLNTGINKQNGSKVTEKYTREEVLTDEQMYNFQRFDEVVNTRANISTNFIDESSSVIGKINFMSNVTFKPNKPDILLFGKEPNEFRISKMKFFRIYNTLCAKDFNLENDRDCVLYALTYNSILTVEQFEIVKKSVNDELFKNIPITGRRVGGR